MDLSILNNVNLKQMSYAVSQFAKTMIKDKRVQVGLCSIPVVGWIGSEIHRGIDNRSYQEKLVLYQEALRKHQAEIDILKNDKEREEYRQKLWTMIHKSTVEE